MHIPCSQGIPTILLLASISLFPACTQEPGSPGDSSQTQDQWEGSQPEFLQSFQLRKGRYYHRQEDLPYTGIVLVQGKGPEPPTEIHIRAGLPYRWLQAGSGQAILQWNQKGLWVGTDAEWEKVFQDMVDAKGIIHLPANIPFHGMVLVVNPESGLLEAEYHYNEKGLSHGPEIHYDEKQNEVGRFDWVNGTIPIQPI